MRKESSITTRPFAAAGKQADEYFAVIEPMPSVSFAAQYEWVTEQIDRVARQLNTQPVFARFHVSDMANQLSLIDRNKDYVISVVGQAPVGLQRPKISASVWFRSNCKINSKAGKIYICSGDDTEIMSAGASRPGEDSQAATERMLGEYARFLKSESMSLADNCLRTWFFVRDVDINYGGVVTGRNNVFAEEGLTPQSHFIASTGIGGVPAADTALVGFDTYAVNGTASRNVTYLYGKSHLNPTYEYGVAFERGVAIDFADRRRVWISGTASIDNTGNIVAPGDICAQFARMTENVDVLLREAGCGLNDIMQATVYVRDPADGPAVEEMCRRRLPGVRPLIVEAPVCRPGWLVEMECMALKTI